MHRNRLQLLMSYRPFMAADDGGGGDPGGDPGGSDGGGNPPSAYFPEGIPDNWRGENDQGTIDTLFGVAKGYRDAEAKRPPVLKSIDDIQFEPGDAIAPYIHDQSDPVMTAYKAAAVKHGLNADQFAGVINETLGTLVTDGLIAAPFNPQKELDSLGEAMGLDRAGVARMATDMDAFATGLAGQLEGVPEQHREAVRERIAEMADDHIGIMALNALQQRLQKGGLRVEGGTVQQGDLTDAELKALDSDDRIDPQSSKYDPELRKKYDAAYQKRYG
jgi:hypothetical protein